MAMQLEVPGIHSYTGGLALVQRRVVSTPGLEHLLLPTSQGIFIREPTRATFRLKSRLKREPSLVLPAPGIRFRTSRSLNHALPVLFCLCYKSTARRPAPAWEGDTCLPTSSGTLLAQPWGRHDRLAAPYTSPPPSRLLLKLTRRTAAVTPSRKMMDMPYVHYGTPWMTWPVMLHSSRDPGTCDLTPEQCAYKSYRWRNWYLADLVYGLNTIYLFVAVIGACMLGFWALRLSPPSLRSRRWWQKLVGGVRYLAYRRFEIFGIGTPSLGVVALLGVGFVFFFAMTLGPKPYYWPTTASFGDSPPLATRTGYMALACMPFMLILPTKANMIASLTGLSHERLIVFHKWVGWAMFVLALIHTFPFIIHNKDDMTMQWNTSSEYWTGVVAILAQAYLQFFSVGFIRNRYYEFFKATHYLAVLIFVVFFFFHCDFRLTSWDYFIASGVLYSLSFLYPQIRTYFEYGFSHRASFELVSERALKVTVPVETQWRPGQHFFLRFVHLGLHAFTAHPFTVCSAPPSAGSSRAAGGRSELVFYVQPRGGLTGRLAAAARQKPAGLSVPVLLDGPYGGVKGRPLHLYDASLVVACGAGASLSLPFVMDALLRESRLASSPEMVSGAEDKEVVATSAGSQRHHRMQVVIATRDEQLVQWYGDALREFMAENAIEAVPEAIAIHVYQTDAAPGYSSSASSTAGSSSIKGGAAAAAADADPEKSAAALGPQPTAKSTALLGSSDGESGSHPTMKLNLRVTSGARPDLAAVVREATARPGLSVGIAACGPAAVLAVVQEEAAAAQLRILRSDAGAREVYLHSEVFSW
ncbi:putative FRE ferric reductase-like transmembrane component [Xylariaceae sp. FL0804]|nr:putative FRE ferric reductase-like transmembrane component [Xylariaceae sp. FL0804]